MRETRGTGGAISGGNIARRTTASRYCIKRSGDDYKGAFVWYSIPGVPNFDACSYCYNTHIAPTPLASIFVAQDDGPEVVKYCDFYHPRTTGLWYQCARSGNIDPFVNYLHEVAPLSACPDTEGTTPLPGLQWLSLTANRTGGPEAIDGFVVCRRCYECIVRATPFADRFEPSPQAQGPQETWSCDLALPSVEDVFTHSARGAGVAWSDIQNAIQARFAAQQCTGAAGSTEPRHWWVMRDNAVRDFAVCDQHYHDVIIPSGRSQEFMPKRDPQPPGENWSCDFAALNMLYAFRIATELNLHSQYWRDAVAATFGTPKCVATGVIDGDFYRLLGPNGPVENTDFCAACYFSYLRPFGFDKYFVRETNTKGTNKICDLAVGLPRTPVYLRKVLKAGNSGDFSILQEHIVAHSTIPMCLTSGAVSDGRKTYGTNEFLICEECYFDVVRPSTFPYPIPTRPPRYDERCALWPGDVRGLWDEACKTGDLTAVATRARENQNRFHQQDQNGLMLAQSRLALSMSAGAAMRNVTRGW